jgi:hypothetical protein
MEAQAAKKGRGPDPRRWVGVAAAALLAVAAAVQVPVFRSKCPEGSLRSWGLCNGCGEPTRDRVGYESRKRGEKAKTFRYYCAPCVERAPREIRAKSTDSEDWSAALRMGIQGVVLGVMALGILIARFQARRPLPLWWDAVALAAGPAHVGMSLLGTPSSWIPLGAAGAFWGLALLRARDPM